MSTSHSPSAQPPSRTQRPPNRVVPATHSLHAPLCGEVPQSAQSTSSHPTEKLQTGPSTVPLPPAAPTASTRNGRQRLVRGAAEVGPRGGVRLGEVLTSEPEKPCRPQLRPQFQISPEA